MGLSMTLGRNLMSSQDPGMPGRPGDVILGDWVRNRVRAHGHARS